MQWIPRSRAFYVVAAGIYAVVVFAIIVALFRGGLVPLAFALFLGSSLVAAVVAYRIAAATTEALGLERLRAARVAITSAEAAARAEREALRDRITERSHAGLDPDELLRLAVEDVGRALRVTSVVVALGGSADELRVTQEWTSDGVAPLGLGSQLVPAARIAVREARTIVAHDLERDERLATEDGVPDLVQRGTRAMVAAPIGLRGQTVGAFLVGDGRTRTWIDDEVRLVETVAKELRVAMESARLVEQRQRESDRMLALHRASAILAGQTDPRVVLEEILKNAVRLVGKVSGSLYIWVPEAKILRNIRDHQVTEGSTPKALRTGEGTAGMAFQTMAPFIVNDYQAWDGATPSAKGAGQRAALGVPLVRKGEPIGALVVRSYDPSMRFSEEDGRLLVLFADLAVAALSAAESFEQQRAAVHELERLSKAKSDFISIISHEFRTPLTGIQGFSEMIRDEDLAPSEIRDYAGDINKDAQRLGRMINDMLDLDRLESGRMLLNRETVDLNSIIAEVADNAQPHAPGHPIRLRLDRALPKLSGDRDKLTQVMTNLLGNAVKYSPDGGDITITSRVDGPSVHVSVVDRGLGIPEDALERVFERYARLESKKTMDIQGTGLGLPIVRQIVDMHGGRVWVESTLGVGSDFQFTLPLAAPPESV